MANYQSPRPASATNVSVATLLVMSLAVALMLAAAEGQATTTMGPTMAEPAGAPGPAGIADKCLTGVLNMSDCLSYVDPGSNLTVPDKPCCPELAGLVESNPICLCQLLVGNKSSSSSGVGSLGLNVDVNRALKLPSVCHVSTPPVSLCSMAGVPVGVPTAASVGSPGASPAAAGGANESASSTKGAAAANLFPGSMLACLVGTAISSLVLSLLLAF